MKYVIAAYCLLFFSIQAQAQYQVTHFTTENGISSNGIKGMQWDEHTGFLWIATEAGLVRYDGMGFKTFDVSTNPEFGSNRIIMVVKNTAGKIIVGGEDGNLSIIKNNVPVFYFKGAEEAKKEYGHFGAVAASDTLFKKCFNNPWDERYNFYNSTVVPLNDTSCEVLTGGELYYYSVSTEQPLNITGLPDNLKKAFSIDKQVYLVNADNNLLLFDVYKNTLQKVALINADGSSFEAGKEEPVFFWETSLQLPVLLCGGKAWLIEKKQSTVLTATLIGEDIPQNVFIRFAQYEKNGKNLFLGSASKGLYVVHQSQLSVIYPPQATPYERNAMYSQVELPNGNILMHDGRIVGYNKPEHFNIPYPFFNNVYAISDSTLIIVKGDSIFKYNSYNQRSQLLARSVAYENFCFAVTENKLYYINRTGIGVIKNNGIVTFLQYFNSNTTPPLLPYAMIESSPGKLLIATCTGLLHFDTHTRLFDTVFKSPTACFRCLFKEGDYIFMGTYGGGFYVMKNGIIKAMPLDTRQYLKYTHCFLKDDRGFCWMSTNNGLFKAKLSDIIDAYEKELPHIYYQYMGKDEGMEVTEMNGGCMPCALKLKNGIFSFPMMDGMLWFKPENVNVSAPSKDIYIDKIEIDNKIISLDNKDAFQVPSAFSKLEVQVVTSAWCRKENLYIDYRMDDAPWMHVDIIANEIKITLGNADYGDHVLQVRKLNGFGINNYSITSIPFTIATPYYQQWWFRILALFFLFNIGFVYVKLRLRQYRLRDRKLLAMVEEKTRDLNVKNIQLEKNDRIKTRLISVINHDIITPLKFMHYAGKALIVNKGMIDEEEQTQTIAEITQAARDMEMLSSQILNWIIYQNPHERMQKEEFDLHQLVEMIFGVLKFPAKAKNTTLLNEVPVHFVVYQHMEPLRVLIYNIVMNSTNFTKNGSVTVKSNYAKDKIVINVEDTGLGMTAEQIDNLMSDERIIASANVDNKKGTGLGYMIIKDLLNMMEGYLEIKSKKNIGTIVSVFLPQGDV